MFHLEKKEKKNGRLARSTVLSRDVKEKASTLSETRARSHRARRGDA